MKSGNTRINLLMLTVALIGLASAASAEIICGYTAEWLSHQSCLIAFATPVAVEDAKGESNFTKARFKLIEVYKGPLSNGDTVTVFDLPRPHKESLLLQKALAENKKLLIFCDIADNVAKEVDGKYMFTVIHEFSSAYYVDQAVEKLYTPDFQLLSAYSEMLERVKKQIQEERLLHLMHPEMNVLRRRIEVPFDAPAYRTLYAGSSCYLWVPEYQVNASKQ